MTFDIEPEKLAPVPASRQLEIPQGYKTYVKNSNVYNLYKENSFRIDDLCLVDPDGKNTKDICGYALYVNDELVGTYNQKQDYSFAGVKSDLYIKLPVDTIRFLLFQRIIAQEKLKRSKDPEEIKTLEDKIISLTEALKNGYELPKTAKNLALAETFDNLSKRNSKSKTPKLKVRANLFVRLKYNVLSIVKAYSNQLKVCLTATKTRFKTKKLERQNKKEQKNKQLKQQEHTM